MNLRPLITIFILWNMGAVLFTNNQSAFLPRFLSAPFDGYARLTRVMQRWSLFAPEPRRYIGLYFFRIQFKDRSIQDWQRPLPPNWDYFERQHAYNWQKFDLASNHMEDIHFWPDLAAWIERKFHDDHNPVAQIQLFHRVAETPPPETSNNFKFSDKNIFTYSTETKQFQ
jgi:hypothetical protein